MEKIKGTNYNKAIVLYGSDDKILEQKAKEMAEYNTNPNNVYRLDGWNDFRFYKDPFLFEGVTNQKYMVVLDLRHLESLTFFFNFIADKGIIRQRGKRSFYYRFDQIIVTINTYQFNPSELSNLDAATKGRYEFIECK